MAASSFAERVVVWQRAHGRHGLPWQGRDPYRVWLSEVMLQQTQVAVVLIYFDRFVARFADVQALAAAEIGDVLALWSGLGYYGRARNLHLAARQIVDLHGGTFPTTSAGLATLPGIGRSTAAAIAAFCFGERVAILDGNVKRVLARVLAFDADLAVQSAERKLWDAASALLPATGIEAYTQGLMDLGAGICTARSPSCLLCPVRDACAAAQAGTQERYPVRSRPPKRKARSNVWLEMRWRGAVWLLPRPARGIWAGLWSLPEFDAMPSLATFTAGWPGRAESLEPFTHVLTHLDWTLQPVRWTFPEDAPADAVARCTAAWTGGRWYAIAELRDLGLPAPLRKRLAESHAQALDRPSIPDGGRSIAEVSALSD